MSEQIRFISQRDEAGKYSYGHCHEEDNNGRPLTQTQSDIESARRIKEMNGQRALSMGFTKFYVTIQYYRYEGTKDMGNNWHELDEEPMEQWKFLRASESVEITGA